MFHRLAGIAVTEQFVQVCAVRRWRLFFCPAAASSSNLSNKYNVTQCLRMQEARGLQKSPKRLHYLACTEALARKSKGSKAGSRHSTHLRITPDNFMKHRLSQRPLMDIDQVPTPRPRPRRATSSGDGSPAPDLVKGGFPGPYV